MKKINLKILFKDRIKACGYYNPNNHNIEISTKETLNRFIETFYHEYTHFILDILSKSLKYKLNKHKKDFIVMPKKMVGEHIACQDIERYCAKRILKLIKVNHDREVLCERKNKKKAKK